MNRRDVISGAAGLAFVGFAGCLGALGMAEHEATPAGVHEDVRADTEYEQVGVDELVVSETFERGGYEETVQVTNYLTEHEKSVSLGPLGDQRAAVFIVLTTPQVSLLGREFNPIEDYSTGELVDLVADNYDDIGEVEHDRDDTVTILDQETTQSRFEADASFDGHDVPVYLHVSESVRTASDHLVTIGVYPQTVDEEEENILSLMGGVVEEADVNVEGAGDGDDDGSDGDDDGSDGDDDGSDGDNDDGGSEDDDGIGL